MKIRTEEGLKNYYKEKDIVASYEKSRYGNIKKSLPHWLDCDAVEDLIRKHAAGQGPLLDLACGTGRLTRALGTKGWTVVSADFAADMLRAADSTCRAQGVAARFVQADALRLPFASACFSAVYTIRFIRHHEKDSRRRIYQEIRRVLRPGGALVFDVLNASVDKEPEKRLIYDETYTLAGIAQELEDNGFRLVGRLAGNIVGVPIVTLAKKWSLIPFGRFLARRYRSRDDILGRATYWVVAAQRKDT